MQWCFGFSQPTITQHLKRSEVGTSSALLLGSGPYKVTEFVPDSHVNFERVDTWWGDLPEAKHITVKFIPDEGTRLLAAQSGDIDIAFNVPLVQASQRESLDSMRVDYVNDLSYVGMYCNTALAPFDDPKGREAFAHSVDRTTIVDKLQRRSHAVLLHTRQPVRGIGIHARRIQHLELRKRRSALAVRNTSGRRRDHRRPRREVIEGGNLEGRFGTVADYDGNPLPAPELPTVRLKPRD